MNNLDEIAKNTITNYLNSDLPKEKIEQKVEGMFDEIINDLFRSYGDIAKQIKETLKETIKLDLNTVNLEEYNAVILAGLKKRINEVYQNDAQKHCFDLLEKQLEPAPESIDIHEFLTNIGNFIREEHQDDFEQYGNDDSLEITIEDYIHNDSPDSYSIKIDMPESRTRLGKILHLFILEGHICISHRMVFNPTFLRDVDGYVFKLYAGKTKITGVSEYDEYKIDHSIYPSHD